MSASFPEYRRRTSMVTKILQGFFIASAATQDTTANLLDVRTQIAATRTFEEATIQTQFAKDETMATATTATTTTAQFCSDRYDHESSVILKQIKEYTKQFELTKTKCSEFARQFEKMDVFEKLKNQPYLEQLQKDMHETKFILDKSYSDFVTNTIDFVNNCPRREEDDWAAILWPQARFL